MKVFHAVIAGSAFAKLMQESICFLEVESKWDRLALQMMLPILLI